MNCLAFEIMDEDLEIIKINNMELYTTLYERFSNFMFIKYYFFCSTKQKVEDLMHDVFEKLIFSLKSFEGAS